MPAQKRKASSELVGSTENMQPTKRSKMNTSTTPSTLQADTNENNPPVTQNARSDKYKGKTRINAAGQLQYLDEVGEWHNAVFHQAIRGVLIEQSQPPSGVGYDHPDPSGIDINDKTSFLPSQRSWGRNVGERPHVLTIFERPWAASDTRANEKPQWLKNNGMVVLNKWGRPIHDWPHLPLTLSSEVDKWKLEALFRVSIQENRKFEQVDSEFSTVLRVTKITKMPTVLARMPNFKMMGKGRGQRSVPLTSCNTYLSMPSMYCSLPSI